MKLMIKLAESNDCAAISRLAGETFCLACPENCDKTEMENYIAVHLSENAFRQMLDSNNLVIIAKQQNGIAGMMVLIPSEESLPEIASVPAMQVQKLYVSTDYHGVGVASELINRMVELTREHGYRKAWLTVFSGNKRAIRFYEKMGFITIGTTEFHMGNEVHLDNLMALDII